MMKMAALDVGVTSPDAAGAGDDCTHAMVVEKQYTYAPHLDAIRRAGMQYQPMVWSAYGRPHPDATQVLVTMARAVARRRGSGNFRGLARRWAARIATEIWRRAAKQVDTDKVQELFAEFDTDSDGSISVSEFTEMMIKLGLAPPKEPGKESASRAKIDEGA